MSLPPLPTKDIGETDCQAGHSDESMQAYGQRCKEAALDEAAKLCESLACTADHDSTITRLECAAKIRSLK